MTSKDRLYGTLDILILRTLVGGPRHGYAIAKWIEDATRQSLSIEDGSLYPSLYRMEERGWVKAEWGQSELGRRAKFYRITPTGRRQLKRETAAWSAFVRSVSVVLAPEST